MKEALSKRLGKMSEDYQKSSLPLITAERNRKN